MQLQYSEVHDSILSQISSLELLVQDICNMAFCHNIGINAIKKKIQKHYDKYWRQKMKQHMMELREIKFKPIRNKIMDKINASAQK